MIRPVGAFGRALSRIGATASLSICVCGTSAGAAPERLPPEALSLQYVLNRGCFPFVQGQKTEGEAFGSLGMRRRTPFAGFGSQPAPRWTGPYKGLVGVIASPGACTVTIHGPDVATYERVAIELLRVRISADTDADSRRSISARQIGVAGIVRGCSDNIRYSYLRLPARRPSGELLVGSTRGLEVHIAAARPSC